MNIASMSALLVFVAAVLTTAAATVSTDAPWWLSAAITAAGFGLGYAMALGCLNMGHGMRLKDRKGWPLFFEIAGYMALPFVLPVLTIIVCGIASEALLSGLGYRPQE